MGSSSSGKTTLIKLISLLYVPNRGSIYFSVDSSSGQKLTKISTLEHDFRHIRSQIGIVSPFASGKEISLELKRKNFLK